MDVNDIIKYFDPKVGEHYLRLPRRMERKVELDFMIALAEQNIHPERTIITEEPDSEIEFNAELFHQFIQESKKPKEKQKEIKYLFYTSGFRSDVYSIENDWTKYIFIPTNLAVRRVPQYALGTGVLGRTWTGTGVIEILGGLYGDDFDEVLMHEVLHNIYPSDSEYMIRHKTKQRMPFQTKWN